MPVEVLPELTIIWPKTWNAKRICVDIDGVICEYNIPSLVKNFFGVDISQYMIPAYNLADWLGVSTFAINTMFKEQVYGKPNFIVGAIETLAEWKSEGHELVIYSNRVKYMGYYGLAQWLIDWQVPFSGIDGGQGEYDVHIDDYPQKLRNTNSKLSLLYDQPWNRACMNIENVLHRVHSWKEIKDVCSSLDT